MSISFNPDGAKEVKNPSSNKPDGSENKRENGSSIDPQSVWTKVTGEKPEKNKETASTNLAKTEKEFTLENGKIKEVKEVEVKSLRSKLSSMSPFEIEEYYSSASPKEQREIKYILTSRP